MIIMIITILLPLFKLALSTLLLLQKFLVILIILFVNSREVLVMKPRTHSAVDPISKIHLAIY